MREKDREKRKKKEEKERNGEKIEVDF